MIRRPPVSTRTATLFPATTRFRSGFRLILPDLRGHGESGKPHDPAAYPPDALTEDGLALVEQMGLTDYDLGGYSLGARTTARMLARRSEEHTSELQSLMRISYAFF